jgi:hypothetical protein
MSRLAKILQIVLLALDNRPEGRGGPVPGPRIDAFRQRLGLSVAAEAFGFPEDST